jgi:AraC-like DNA-binding protein
VDRMVRGSSSLLGRMEKAPLVGAFFRSRSSRCFHPAGRHLRSGMRATGDARDWIANQSTPNMESDSHDQAFETSRGVEPLEHVHRRSRGSTAPIRTRLERRRGPIPSSSVHHTPKQAIQDRLTLEARRLLAHTNLPISTIATQLGFHDPSNFATFFTHHTGDTPTAFRDQQRPTRKS